VYAHSRVYHRRWKLEEVQEEGDSESDDDDEDLTDQEVLEVCCLLPVCLRETLRERERER
jgi:hypothetical protein